MVEAYPNIKISLREIRWRWRESNPRPKNSTTWTSTSVGNCSFLSDGRQLPKVSSD